MTRKEVLLYLHTLKWFLADLGYTCVAGDYEDAEMKLYADGITVAQCQEYADMIGADKYAKALAFVQK